MPVLGPLIASLSPVAVTLGTLMVGKEMDAETDGSARTVGLEPTWLAEGTVAPPPG